MGLLFDSDETPTEEEGSDEVTCVVFVSEVRAMLDEYETENDEGEERTREVWMKRLLKHLGVEGE